MISKVTRTRAFFWSLLFVATFPNVLEWASCTRQSLSLVMAVAQSGRRATAAVVSSAGTTAETRTKDCVIVGGGPVGLAAARTLAQSPHHYKVTVLEQTAAGRSSVRQYDPTRSYLYNINRRGLTWFNLPGNEYALHQLEERGYAPTEGGASGLCRIPADPEAPILPPKAIQVANVASVSRRKNTATATKATFGGSYWIPRHDTVDLLMLACEEQNDNNSNQTTLASAAGGGGLGGVLLRQGGSITILPNKMVKSLVVSNDNDSDNDGLLTVQCTDGTSVTASLVVAADGIDSTVRSILAGDNNNEPAVDSGSNSSGWLQSKARSFRIKKYRSPATGLLIKALQFPPHFTLTNVTGEIIPTRPDCFYSFRGAYTGSRSYINIGMLPLKRVGVTRPGNLIAPHDHEVWQCRNGSAVKAWIEKCFPRVDWNDMIPDANEWERFAKAKATVFPYCQYSPGSSVTAPGGTTGVVLVGDACHAFPPDIGQGINAGLLDVVALDDALRGRLNNKNNKKRATSTTSTTWTLKDALTAYETNRGPEHRALIRLARFGAPFQYSQPWKRHRVGKFLWTANVGMRLLLHTLTAKLVAPPAIIMMVRHPERSFRDIMRRADSTTFGIYAALTVVVYKLLVLKKWIPSLLP